MSRLKLQWVKFTKFQFTMLTGSPSVPHPPQFNTSVPHKRATPFQPPKSLSSTLKTPQFNTFLSVQLQNPPSSIQKGQSFSAPKISQFNTKNPSVQHNPFSSTPKTPQFHTKNPSVQHTPLSSTPKTPQFNTPPSVPPQKTLSSTSLREKKL